MYDLRKQADHNFINFNKAFDRLMNSPASLHIDQTNLTEWDNSGNEPDTPWCYELEYKGYTLTISSFFDLDIDQLTNLYCYMIANYIMEVIIDENGLNDFLTVTPFTD